MQEPEIVSPRGVFVVEQPVVQTCPEQQPRPPPRDWATDLCACCYDFKTCCCAFFCPCCLLAQMTSRMGESCCVQCIPCGVVAMRTKMRERYNIQGSVCKDCCTITCCYWCTICQMDRELNTMEMQGQFCN